MSGRYGTRASQRALELGDYEDAVRTASEILETHGADAGALYDRARARELLEQYAPAVEDMFAAARANASERVVELFELDDALFSLLVAAAQAAPASASATLARYRDAMPEGQHLADVAEWQRRLGGSQPSLLDKTIPLGR